MSGSSRWRANGVQTGEVPRSSGLVWAVFEVQQRSKRSQHLLGVREHGVLHARALAGAAQLRAQQEVHHLAVRVQHHLPVPHRTSGDRAQIRQDLCLRAGTLQAVGYGCMSFRPLRLGLRSIRTEHSTTLAAHAKRPVLLWPEAAHVLDAVDAPRRKALYATRSSSSINRVQNISRLWLNKDLTDRTTPRTLQVSVVTQSFYGQRRLIFWTRWVRPAVQGIGYSSLVLANRRYPKYQPPSSIQSPDISHDPATKTK